MNGIDIASYQRGIDLSQIPADFVIVKATENVGYVNPDFIRAINQGLALGKKMGIYHYAGGSDPVREAKFFLKIIEPYLGKAILCLDWESTNNASYGRNDSAWCMRFMDYVYDTTGVKMFLYISAGLSKRFTKVLEKYHFWAAQYANYNMLRDFQEHPWNEGKYECDIRQYSSCLWLPGWRSRLDANKAYITPAEWDAAASVAEEAIEEVTVDELAQEVLNGKWGNGDERKKLLEAAGHNYDEVQSQVNAIVADEEITALAWRVIAGEFGNGLEREKRLGDKYKAVQDRVNKLYIGN